MTLIQIGCKNGFFYEKRQPPLHTQATLQFSRLATLEIDARNIIKNYPG